jgi:hypothetical protein
MSLKLRDNLHWCDSGGRAVFLDVVADRYFCLSEPANQAFLRLAAGITRPEDSALLQRLVAHGMLIETGEDWRIMSPPSIEEPTSDFLDDAMLSVDPVRVLRALVSEVRAMWSLRAKPFHEVIGAVQGGAWPRGRVPTNSKQRIEEIVSASAAAAFVTRSHDRCLVRALATYSMCRNKGLSPQLVFGVIAHPFAAHSWVQLGSAVLVGGYEQARLYTPILVLQ